MAGETYEGWARSIRKTLRVRKRFGFVDGTTKKPNEDSPDLEDWWTINSLLVSWIRTTIKPTLRSTISHKEEAEELWTSIREQFVVINRPQMHQLKAELAECKQKGRTIVDYYGKLTKLWEKLKNYEQILTFKCGKCTFNVGTALEPNREEEKVHLFLMGLDKAMYGTIGGRKSKNEMKKSEDEDNNNREVDQDPVVEEATTGLTP
ncbi:uncharacterized protein LOC132644147 [Lycium barbarum]|uniref:uncharacterized protein LOC132644147 n=1 Tax=Lycium barbarum TaxID=112863 RepID=UPI00293E455B|nr:uncharacterized protein LOC132644147 [Lycium barbarum]